MQRTDAAFEERADKVFTEVLGTILHAPGKCSRSFVIDLTLGFIKGLALRGGRGDIALIAKKIGISNGFASRILHAHLDGTEASLKEKRRRSTAFSSRFFFQLVFQRLVYRVPLLACRLIFAEEDVLVNRGIFLVSQTVTWFLTYSSLSLSLPTLRCR